MSLASPARIELATSRLGGARSIQLSYGDSNRLSAQFTSGCAPLPTSPLLGGLVLIRLFQQATICVRAWRAFRVAVGRVRVSRCGQTRVSHEGALGPFSTDFVNPVYEVSDCGVSII